MASYDYIPERRTSVLNQAAARRISWGAVFAGAMTAVLSQLLLTLLGMGVGFATINPATEQNPFSGLGVGSAIWWSISMLGSLFLGGWVAGRVSGIPRKGDGFLHGFLSWGVVTLASVMLLTTAVGTIVGGVGSLVGKTVGGGTQLTAQAAQAEAQQGDSSLLPSNIQQKAQQAVQGIKQKASQTNPGQIETKARQTGEAAAKGMGFASFGSFAILLLGAMAGGWGGRLGAPRSLYFGPIRRDAPQAASRETAAAGR